MSPAPAPPGPQQLASTLALAVASTLLTLYTVARLASVRTSPHWVWAALAAGLGTTGVCVDVALVAVCGAARVPERVLLLLGAGTATLLTFAFACVAGGPRAWALYANDNETTSRQPDTSPFTS
ncbi:hypothetical protein Q8F55_004438 [Vanrija albida]|uniref:MARVEL domain-containing protein n=1 Tax=Vanrija albida TaxID=181172 RepID=A0ABR3Q714_9TREE